MAALCRAMDGMLGTVPFASLLLAGGVVALSLVLRSRPHRSNEHADPGVDPDKAFCDRIAAYERRCLREWRSVARCGRQRAGALELHRMLLDAEITELEGRLTWHQRFGVSREPAPRRDHQRDRA